MHSRIMASMLVVTDLANAGASQERHWGTGGLAALGDGVWTRLVGRGNGVLKGRVVVGGWNSNRGGGCRRFRWILETLYCNPKGRRALLRIPSTEGRSVCLCWAPSKPKGPTGPRSGTRQLGFTSVLGVGGGVRIHPENARMSGRHGVQYVAQCVACAALTPVVWQ